MTVVELFHSVKNTAGTLAKKQLLSENINPLVHAIFEATYGEHKYFVTKLDVDGCGDQTIEEGWEDFKQVLFQCENHHISGNEAREALSYELKKYREEDQEILMNVIQHNLKIGISLDNWLSIIGKPVDKFEVSLAHNLKDVKNVDPVDGTYFASRKLDGCVDYYSNIEFEDGTIKTIGEVVENQIHGKIKSFDGKNIVYSEISNFWKGDDQSKQWIEIELESGQVIKITDNDRLMTNNGWKYVRDLAEGDKIMIE